MGTLVRGVRTTGNSKPGSPVHPAGAAPSAIRDLKTTRTLEPTTAGEKPGSAVNAEPKRAPTGLVESVADLVTETPHVRVAGEPQPAPTVEWEVPQPEHTAKGTSVKGEEKYPVDPLHRIHMGDDPDDDAAPRDERGTGPYKTRTVAELRAVAREKGLTGYGKLNKKQLLKAVSK